MMVAGVVLLAAGLAMVRRTRALVTRCRCADGYVAGYTKEEDSDGSVYYFSRVRFEDCAGVDHELPGPGGNRSPPKAGVRVSITYDPSDPRNAWITGAAAPWVIPWLIALVGVAVLVGAFAVRAET